MDEKAAKELCQRLLQAESEKEVKRILRDVGYWNDSAAWRQFGDKENNFSIIGNQQSSPIAAMAEKLINSVDAVLMRECYREGVNPESKKAPKTIAEALERYFDVKDGNLANIGTTRRTQLARNIGLIATGTRRTPNYTVFDLGEGQTPANMPNTLLSLTESNKMRIPFVQGKFNMGGTGVLQFCGHHNFQIIITKRDPQIADPNDPSADYWGVTIVRREDPREGRRSSVFTYLAPDGKVPRFRSPELKLPEHGGGTEALPSLGWGTVIKMFAYEMTGLKTNILLDLYYRLSLLLPRIGLPVRFYERRGYSGHSLETTLTGLHVRLEEDKRDNVEEGFPTHAEFRVDSQKLRASIYAFRKGASVNYRNSEGVIFTINGQTHGTLPASFFTRRSVGMSYLAKSILVILDCDGLNGRSREDLFMNSRDRLRSGDLRSKIEKSLEELLRQHPGLRELRERRRREEIAGKLADARPLKEVLDNILKKSPALSALFVRGEDIGNPFRSRHVGEKSTFEGKPHPTYFTLMAGHQKKNCHIDQRFRVQFETDVVNDYFSQDRRYPGKFTLHINGKPADDCVPHLWNGVATLTLSLPPGTKIGDTLVCEARVNDETLIEPFYNRFTRHVLAPRNKEGGPSGRRLPPAGEGTGNRQIPDTLAVPKVKEVSESEWADRGFDKYSALQVVDAGENGYDFYVNMDNVYLQAEIKAAHSEDPRLMKAQFKYALVLIGLALLKEEDTTNGKASLGAAHSSNEEEVNIEKQVCDVTRAIAPVLVPMIKTLGELEIDESVVEEDEAVAAD